jgi:hypothetical protein
MPVESLTTAKTIFPLLRVRYIQPLKDTWPSDTGDLSSELMLVNEDILTLAGKELHLCIPLFRSAGKPI